MRKIIKKLILKPNYQFDFLVPIPLILWSVWFIGFDSIETNNNLLYAQSMSSMFWAFILFSPALLIIIGITKKIIKMEITGLFIACGVWILMFMIIILSNPKSLLLPSSIVFFFLSFMSLIELRNTQIKISK